MKKVLLGLSCVLAMAISLQASATKGKLTRKGGDKAAKTGNQAAGTMSTGIQQAGKTAGQVETVVNGVKVGADVVNTVSDEMFQTAQEINAQAAGQAQENLNLNCKITDYGYDVAEIGLVELTACNTALTASAKGVHKNSFRLGNVVTVAKQYGATVKDKMKKVSTDGLGYVKSAYITGYEWAVDGIRNGGPVDLSKARENVNKICNQCKGLLNTQVCAVQAI